MNDQRDNSPVDAKGFCTFCMDLFEPAKMGPHLRRCRDRVLDAGEIQLNGREHPMAYILRLEVVDLPDFWLCMEAHAEARFSELDRLIRRTWFPHSATPGGFVLPEPKRASGKREAPPLELHTRLQNALTVRDKFAYRVRHGRSAVEVLVDAVGLLPTAIGHRPIDIVAFPLNRGILSGPRPGWEPVPFLA